MLNLAYRRMAADAIRVGLLRTSGMTLALAVLAVGIARAAQPIKTIDAGVVAVNIPGASAIAQIGTFLNVPPPGACANPIPSKFPSYIQPGAVLDPKRLLVGSQSNFGAALTNVIGQEGSFLSIDPSDQAALSVPPDFASSGDQASTLGSAVQMFSANSQHWLNGVNNPSASTAQYTGVSNPLGLSDNNAFGRIWPANAPFGDSGKGSSSILDPTGLPLKGAPNPLIGGVYFGDLTNRNVVTMQAQIISGGLNTGAVGTALLGPSPDGSCKAVFAVVTADGAVVQEHTLKGLDGLAPLSTVSSIVNKSWLPPNNDVEPRLGVLMNPYIPSGAPLGTVRQLFVSEPFKNTIAVINLGTTVSSGNQVFIATSTTHIASTALNLPVDLAPAQRDNDNVNWASNSTLDQGSDIYVANRGNNTIVRMRQDGTVVAIAGVTVNGSPLDGSLNGIAVSPDGNSIYVTFVGPGAGQGGVLALPAFGR